MDNIQKVNKTIYDMETETVILNKSGDKNEYLFETLLTIIANHNSDEYRLFYNYFLSDTIFIQLLEKPSCISDVIFYLLTKCNQYVQDNRFLYNDIMENGNFHPIFDKQFTDNEQFYPTLRIISDKKRISVRFNQFKCLYFLFGSLKRLGNVRRRIEQDVIESSLAQRIGLLLKEAEVQILDHISLIDSGISTKNCPVIKTEQRFTQENTLLPFIIGNDEMLADISNLVRHMFLKSGFDQSVPVGFFSTFGNVLMNLHHSIIKFSVDTVNHELILRSVHQLMTIKTPESTIKHPIIALMTKLPNWTLKYVTDAKGQEFERLTFFGAFLSGSMFADDNSEIATSHFETENIDEQNLSTTHMNLKSKLDSIWDIQFQMVKLILVEKSTHSIAIDYLSRALCINSTRGHLQPDESTASSEGFITNTNVIIQRLVAPIKLDKIEIDYLTYNANSEDNYNIGRLLNDETRINVDKQALMGECDRLIRERTKVEPPNFHTSCFFLAGVSHHYGILASIRKQARRESAIQSLERNIAEISRMIEQNQFNSQQLEVSKTTLARYQSMVSFQKRASLCSEIVLSHDTYLRSSLEYFIQVAQVISTTLNHDISTLNSSITTVSSSFSCFPQFFFDDLADFLIFIISKHPHVFGFVNRIHDLISFIMFLSTHSHLVKSPYLVAKFVEVIFSFLPNVNNHNSLHPIFQSIVSHYSVTSGFLTNRLISFYIEVEKTGSTSEFYDKFSIRFKISIIFRTLWKQGNQMKIHLLSEVHDDLEKFVKFVNRAMNDMVYLLDESITALKRIRTNQEKKNDPNEWLKLSRQEQSNILQQLNHDERSTKSQLTLADVTVEMLYDFTQEIKEPFLCSELVDKLAAMLNSFLLELVGSKCRDLKVNEPEKYHWNPKKLLQNIVRIYLNLDSNKLIEAVSNEERFYSSKLFTDALSKLRTYNIISSHEVEHFDNFRQKVESLVQERQIDDADLDEVPAEYLDPIMSSIMKEPVMLPKSKIIVDKSVIKRHLLNDDCDPFNRQPLKLEELIPQPELQKEIQEWRSKKRTNRKK